MRFAHIADNHLGCRQYGIYERENDFYSAFQQAVEKIIEERPDFVIHSGDLFDSSRPPTKALLNVQKALMKLRDRGINVYAIPGNHDILMRKNAMPPQVLYRNFNLKLISPKNQFYIHNGIFIGGVPYRSKFYADSLKQDLTVISKQAEKYKKRILVLHQSIDKYLPFEFELKFGDLPQCFDYYALGHIHKRITDNYGQGKIAYPGSTEMWSIEEYKTYKQDGKGFFLVDIDSDMPEIHNINLELPREIINEDVYGEKIDEEIQRIIKILKNLKQNPMVFLRVLGCGFDVNSVHKKLLDSLSQHVLTLRPTYCLEKPEESEITAESLDIKKILSELCKNDEEMLKLSTALFETLSVNDTEAALEIAEKAYSDFHDNK